MNAIWKYQLRFQETELILPMDSKILSVQNQNDSLVAWFIVDLEQKTMETRKFIVIMTGEPFQWVNEYGDYKMINIDTVQIGSIVCHIFEVL